MARCRSSRTGGVVELEVLDISLVGCMVDRRARVRGPALLVKLEGLTYQPATVIWVEDDKAGIMFENMLYEPILMRLRQSCLPKKAACIYLVFLHKRGTRGLSPRWLPGPRLSPGNTKMKGGSFRPASSFLKPETSALRGLFRRDGDPHRFARIAGKSVNIASTRFGTRYCSRFEVETASALPSNSRAPSAARSILRSIPLV